MAAGSKFKYLFSSNGALITTPTIFCNNNNNNGKKSLCWFCVKLTTREAQNIKEKLALKYSLPQHQPRANNRPLIYFFSHKAARRSHSFYFVCLLYFHNLHFHYFLYFTLYTSVAYITTPWTPQKVHNTRSDSITEVEGNKWLYVVMIQTQ